MQRLWVWWRGEFLYCALHIAALSFVWQTPIPGPIPGPIPLPDPFTSFGQAAEVWAEVLSNPACLQKTFGSSCLVLKTAQMDSTSRVLDAVPENMDLLKDGFKVCLVADMHFLICYTHIHVVNIVNMSTCSAFWFLANSFFEPAGRHIFSIRLSTTPFEPRTSPFYPARHGPKGTEGPKRGRFAAIRAFCEWFFASLNLKMRTRSN